MNDDPTQTSRVKFHIPWRIRFGLILSLFGMLVFLLGARPAFFGLDRSPVVGFVQITVFLLGLGFICIGGYICFISLWGKEPRSIKADFGARFIATGYVMSVFSGMADVFGFGSHPLPGTPYFGPWQARGVELGELLIGIGLILLLPIQKRIKGRTSR
jgi:hypothetical protein